MVITDELAGTWVFENIISGSSDSAEEKYFEFAFADNKSNYTALIMGAPVNGFIMDMIYANGSYEVIVLKDGVWQDESYKTITITAKLSKVENGDALLACLQANATKQSAITITDLTNTTWVFNNTIDNSVLQGIDLPEPWYIDFHSHGLDLDRMQLENFVSDTAVFDRLLYGDLGAYIGGDINAWEADEYKIITITGGIDVTNSYLISWLFENAVLQVQPITHEPNRLYVKSTGGYFYIKCNGSGRLYAKVLV